MLALVFRIKPFKLFRVFPLGSEAGVVATTQEREERERECV